jgi:hypothetical protein
MKSIKMSWAWHVAWTGGTGRRRRRRRRRRRKKFIHELRCWHARNKHSLLINRSEPH